MKSIMKYCCLLIIAAAIVLWPVSCAQSKTDQVVVIKKTGLPVVYFRVMISAGSAMDPTDKPGLAYYTANLFNKGTGLHTRSNRGQTQSDRRARSVSASTKRWWLLPGKTLSEKIDDFYSVFREILIVADISR